MTGGTPRAGEMNRRLAVAAARCGVGFALGSQRKMLQDPVDSRRPTPCVSSRPTSASSSGTSARCSSTTASARPELRALVADVGADALALHLNPLQEAIQPEGDTRFSALLPKLRAVAPESASRSLLKEVGSGHLRDDRGEDP